MASIATDMRHSPVARSHPRVPAYAVVFGALLAVSLNSALGRGIDGLKIALAGALVFRIVRTGMRLGIGSAVFALGLLPLPLAVLANSNSTSSYIAIASLGAALVGATLSERAELRTAILRGFAFGVACSSLVFLVANFIGAEGDFATSGLSFRRTALSYEAAAGAAIATGFAMERAAGRRLWTFVALANVGAVLASGGRGGLMALTLSALLLLVRIDRASLAKLVKLAISISALGWFLTSKLGVQLTSLDRLLGRDVGENSSGYSSGRSDLLGAAIDGLGGWRFFLGSGSPIIDGTDLAAHNVVLVHLTFAGLLGAVGALLIILCVGSSAFSLRKSSELRPEVLGALTMTLSGIVSNGPLINPERALLFATVSAVLIRQAQRNRQTSRTPVQ